MKSNKSTKSMTNSYVKISKGVYKYPSGNYKVVKTTKGKKIISWFTNVNKAKTYYKSLIK